MASTCRPAADAHTVGPDLVSWLRSLPVPPALTFSSPVTPQSTHTQSSGRRPQAVVLPADGPDPEEINSSRGYTPAELLSERTQAFEPLSFPWWTRTCAPGIAAGQGMLAKLPPGRDRGCEVSLSSRRCRASLRLALCPLTTHTFLSGHVGPCLRADTRCGGTAILRPLDPFLCVPIESLKGPA